MARLSLRETLSFLTYYVFAAFCQTDYVSYLDYCGDGFVMVEQWPVK